MREQGDRQRVLHDVREAIGRPIDAPRVGHDRDDAADDAPGEQQWCKRDDLLAEIGGEISVVEQAVSQRVRRKRQGGSEQPAAHVTVARDAARSASAAANKTRPMITVGPWVQKKPPPTAEAVIEGSYMIADAWHRASDATREPAAG